MLKIYKRGDVWYTRFRNKKVRHNIPLGRDYQQALIDAPRIQAEKRGTVQMSNGSKKDISWHGFKGRYLEWKGGTHSVDGTLYKDRLAFEYLEEEFPIRRLQDITPALLETFQAKLKTRKPREDIQDKRLAKHWQPKSNTNANRILRSIKTAMRKAEEWGLVPPQNWKRVKLLKEPKGKLHFFSHEEKDLMLKRFTGIWKTIAYLGLRAGLRRGEIHNLQWSSVDFKQGVLRVEPSNGWVPKDHEARGIPMAKDLITHLKRLPGRTGYVLGEDRPSLDVMTTYFKKIVKKAGLRGNIHKCRHTFGSHLAQAGASPQQIKELMGHANLKTTEIYMHLAPGNLRAAISLIG